MALLVISYSRADQAQVRAVVSLLQTAFRDIEKTVFWDGQLEPGDPWFEQLKGHIDAAPQLFVFWCDHAAASEQVRREFSYALSRNKRVVPVLLDDTPLAPELSPIHGIDARQAIRHGGRSRYRALVGGAAMFALVLVVAAIAAVFSRQGAAPDRTGSLDQPSLRPVDVTASLMVDSGASGASGASDLAPASHAELDAFLQAHVIDPDRTRIEIVARGPDPLGKPGDDVTGPRPAPTPASPSPSAPPPAPAAPSASPPRPSRSPASAAPPGVGMRPRAGDATRPAVSATVARAESLKDRIAETYKVRPDDIQITYARASAADAAPVQTEVTVRTEAPPVVPEPAPPDGAAGGGESQDTSLPATPVMVAGALMAVAILIVGGLVRRRRARRQVVRQFARHLT